MTEQTKKQVRVILWAIPRSLSTAVFRAMWNKKSCKAMPEPFGMASFFSAERTVSWFGDVEPVEGFNFMNIKKELYEADHPEDEVFAKDMATYLFQQKTHKPEDLIPNGYVHTFLIRRPEEAVKSGYKLFKRGELPGWKEWDSNYVGFKELWQLYEIIKEKTGTNPLVIEAEDLMKNPEATLRLYCEKTGLKFEDAMVNWREDDGLGDKVNEVFPFFKLFTEGVLNTSGIQKTAPAAHVNTDLPEHILQTIAESRVFYDKLLSVATRI